MTLGFTVHRASWAADASRLRSVREAVFIREQGIPADLEWDEQDAGAIHVLAIAADGAAIGTGRLVRAGAVGRMAVLAAYRGQGVGQALLNALLEAAREQGHAEVTLSAQTAVHGFYQRLGFEPIGEIFLEAGIPHQRMRRRLWG
jgi:predicted GNAT family N-acyltransferase